MGRVTERVKVRNLIDIYNAAQGTIEESEIRSIEVDAHVDTGAAYLCLPPAKIAELGLLYSHSQQVLTANGSVERRIFDGAKIAIQDRSVEMAVMENDETTPSLIGDLVLEALDLVVRPKDRTVVPNPEHDGKWIVDLY